MIIKLSTGKELTIDEAKEVYEKLLELTGTNRRDTYVPYPVPQPVYPSTPYPNPWWEFNWSSCSSEVIE